jgi:acyl transferase domain-containing protein
MEPIAIVGFASKLPGRANDAESLWELLKSGKKVSKEWPESRLNIQAFHGIDSQSQGVVRPSKLASPSIS